MAIGRTPSRRKSSAVLRLCSLSSSSSSPATAMPPLRLSARAPKHTNERNLIFDAFVFILTSPSQISLFENVGLREAYETHSDVPSDKSDFGNQALPCR